MMRKNVFGLAMCFMGAAIMGSYTKAQVCDVNQDQERKWINYVIPLPHQIAIRKKAVISPAGVRISLREGAGMIEKHAAEELRGFFKERTGVVPAGNDFEIVLGVMDSGGKVGGEVITEVAKLKDVPNRGQAYVIQSVGDKKLVLAGVSEKGVYYAQVTLRQLLRPVTTKEKVEIPMLAVVDWPDVEERSLWNCGEMPMELAPLIKFNFQKAGSRLSPVSDGKPNHAQIDTNRFIMAQARGMNWVPSISHLNFLEERTGWFQAYPGLKGKGERAKAGQYHAHRTKGKPEEEKRAPCASNPVLVRILTEWMNDIASSGVAECGCWLTERPAQCECEKCLAVGQFVLEARAFVSAWQQVRKNYPDFIIRLFISTPTDEKYDQVMKELPRGVKVERACALTMGRKRGEPRDQFVDEALDPYAGRGVWMATYDIPATANGKVETPEINVPQSSPQRIRDFIRQMHDRKYMGMYGMLDGGVAPDMNVHAIAEWTWNLNGRSEKEFAEAWATLKGYRNPERVAEWVEIMGPVEWDVYDSGYPECYAWGLAAQMIREKKKPVPGDGLFRYYLTKESFDQKIAACEKGLAIARAFENPDLANETAVVMSYARIAKYIYLIAELVSSGDLSKSQAKDQLAKLSAELQKAGEENAGAITAWRTAVSSEPWNRRVHNAIEYTRSTVADVSAAVLELTK